MGDYIQRIVIKVFIYGLARHLEEILYLVWQGKERWPRIKTVITHPYFREFSSGVVIGFKNLLRETKQSCGGDAETCEVCKSICIKAKGAAR